MSSMNDDSWAPWRARLAGQRGHRYWRALEDLAADASFREHVASTMPAWSQVASMDRRGFLKLLGASLAMAGLTGCGRPPEDSIVPWLRMPEGQPDADAIFYATTLCMAGEAVGVLVQTHQGRPTKIEGNPQHPASAGATGPQLQAAILDLWDPDRSMTPRRLGDIGTWDAFAADVGQWRSRFASHGAGLRILSGSIRSPTLQAQRKAWLQRFPGAKWHVHEAIDDRQALAGAQQAFGRPYRCRYRLEKADVVLSLEADLLDGGPAHLAYAWGFAQRRDPERGTMNRLYVVEGTPSATGTMADHRWAISSARIGDVLVEVAVALGMKGLPTLTPSGLSHARIAALARDLQAHRGRGLVVVGACQPPHVHALAHLVNAWLDNAGKTVVYISIDDALPGLAELCRDARAGQVETLFILQANPVYDAPADLDVSASFAKIRHTVHYGLYRDETAHICEWHLPASHPLECWSDAQSCDGSRSIAQPLIAPLYDTRSPHELLALLLGDIEQRGQAIVRNQWKALDDTAWIAALRAGVLPEMESDEPDLPVPADEVLRSWPLRQGQATELVLLWRPDPFLHDGTYANNGWLQECPRPLTQLTWGNAALVSPALAARRGLNTGDLVTLKVRGRALTLPVWVMPGQAESDITVHLGYGRTLAGRVGSEVGASAYILRTQDALWMAAGLELVRADGHVDLASTQSHDRMEGSESVRSSSLTALLAGAAMESAPTPPSLYEATQSGDYAWGMTIDLNACIGCKGCTVACQAENNIPVVGADEVRRGHAMHWIRVDRYYAGSPDAPETVHQPVPCMHCEHAPCELVCPVGATVHDSDGLNVQVYNRCVGTRFCSNNCPYKVRRFNFLQYADLTTESLKGQRNPDVTVRNRGVMEKCTYCIQRIEKAHIQADRENRAIADGEVVTACQAACPTRAIQFGNLKDSGSKVRRTRMSQRHYTLLAELNTRPRTTYLARVRNRHPDLGEDA
ncbi:MAG TPA: TAT-variant-translocated molybdopterin oxidoreductase [Dyella sp.]|uniref:TAT-variant-translocated molybdopterin oxidoreductase n=1 Tax=Dyella sp. TaxID=1869338 RepID=UPI002F920AFA